MCDVDTPVEAVLCSIIVYFNIVACMNGLIVCQSNCREELTDEAIGHIYPMVHNNVCVYTIIYCQVLGCLLNSLLLN